ncbi:MAG: radical SAM protein [Candidatus Bathyarchaeota archaeon]|nr:radical SAM protein [Candidatus Bathyarchaeota archaeon]
MTLFHVCRRNSKECRDCGFCTEHFSCPGVDKPSIERFETACIDCDVCYVACPHSAVERVKDVVPRKQIMIVVDGEYFAVPERTTVKHALELLGLEFGKFPDETKIFAPCETGGCFACAMPINGKPKPACVTPVRDGMTIDLELPKDYVPLRRISGFQPHSVGGVGTPWWVKKSSQRYVEVACFAHGCNLRCPQCQNYMVTYDNVTPALTPFEAAAVLTAERNKYGVDRMAISGGEPTLNQAWLIRFFEELRQLNPDERARLHLDTNATVLTPEFVDGLVKAGVTGVGPDLKGLRTETFMRITGIIDDGLARRYLENAWSITEYIIDSYYPESLFVGVGIPYNRYFITLEEIREMGERIVGINPEVQACLLDYFPSFRRLDMERPSVHEMRKARETLVEAGLKTVLAQTTAGHLGP